MTVWDAVRVVILVLFGLCLGETAWIVRVYFGIVRKTRRLLPYHVLLIGTSFLGLQAEAAWQNAVRIGDEFTPYLVINLVLFALAYVALRLIRVHLTRKRNLKREIVPLVQDRNEYP